MQEANRFIDAMLVARSDGVLLSRGSTFGQVIRALAEGAHASRLGPAAGHRNTLNTLEDRMPQRTHAIPMYEVGENCAPVDADPEPPLRNQRLLDLCGLPPSAFHH